MCFIDFKKARDREKHEKLSTCLQNIRLGGTDIRFVSILYWEKMATIGCENKFSTHINIKMKVCFCDILSVPAFFSLYI